MQTIRNRSSKNKRRASLAAALFAGLAAFSFTACDSTDSSGSCTTTNDPTALITLTSPKCGTSHKVGSTMHVKWTVKDDPDAPTGVDVLMSVDGGVSWGFLNAGTIPNTSVYWGDYAWVVKDSLLVSGVKVGLVGKSALVRLKEYTATEDARKISTLVDPITITAP